MKHKLIKKLLTIMIATTTIMSISSVGASAEWKQNSEGQWNYLDDSGNKLKGWLKDANGKYYYLNNNGIMEHDTTINGYKLGSDGAWIRNVNITNNINNGVINNNITNNYYNNDNFNTIGDNSDNDNFNTKDKIKTSSDLETYLNENYSSLKTPIGTLKLNITVDENDDDNFPYDFWIQTDWGDIENPKYEDLDYFTPYDLEHSVKISDNDKDKTKKLLKEYQEKIAEISMKYFPDKKMEGGFYSGFYKYKYLRTGYKSIKFYSWNNYDIDLSNYKNYTNQYKYSTLTDFQWDTEHDDYFN